MEFSTYAFIFTFLTFLFLCGTSSIFRINGNDKYLFTVMSGIFFLVLAIGAMGLGKYYVDAGGVLQFHAFASDGYEYLIYVFMAVIMGVAALLYSFVGLYTYYKNTVKGVKTPKGF